MTNRDEPRADGEGGRAPLDALEQRLGVRFRDRLLLETALTHPSFAAEVSGDVADYQRLEFLGDAIVGTVTSELLFRRFPDEPEGQLSRLRSRIVSRSSLSRVARSLSLGEAIRLGRGEEQSAGRDKDRILTDVFEAVVGALYLDQGFSATRELLGRVLEPALDRVTASPERRDHKSALQELCQSRWRKTPAYRIVEEHGPPHETVFTAVAVVDERELGRGSGRSKQLAQQDAARDALRQFTEAAP
ncbi:MAG: ribonuclease III [Deltaproteobacteria bacterium]|nr:MAG: ribonuclease III [Deltaproteobacteria bacterium]